MKLRALVREAWRRWTIARYRAKQERQVQREHQFQDRKERHDAGITDWPRGGAGPVGGL